jgi:protein gp37
MREYLTWTHPSGSDRAEAIGYAALTLYEQHGGDFSIANQMILGGNCSQSEPLQFWPLPNVWLGVSAEDQDAADKRIPELLATPAALRFVSYEPALGPVDFTAPQEEWGTPDGSTADWRRHLWGCTDCGGTRYFDTRIGMLCSKCRGRGVMIDWVIVGGESGPGARPFDLAWARSLVRQCQAAGVAVFYKQGGASNRCAHDRKGGHFECFPDDLKVREFPNGNA